MNRSTQVTIDLSALRYNLLRIRELAGEGTRIMGIVKSDDMIDEFDWQAGITLQIYLIRIFLVADKKPVLAENRQGDSLFFNLVLGETIYE